MKITTFCLCILGALAGMWLADLGAWPSAGGIWTICLILAIDGAARPFANTSKPSKGDPITDQDLAACDESLRQRQRTLSVRGGLPESRAPMPPPPPSKKVERLKKGNRVRDKETGILGAIDIAWPDGICLVTFDQIPDSRGVKTPCWYPEDKLELICEKQP